jgi:hypothetical protein
MIILIVNNNKQQTGLKKQERKRKKEKKEKYKKGHFSILMCFCKDVLIFYCLFFPSTVLRTSLSLSHYYPIDYKQSLYYVSICTSYTLIEKKVLQKEGERERERDDELYNNQKKRKKGKKRTRHTSASSTIVIIFLLNVMIHS